MVQNNFNVNKIMNDSVFWDEDSINGDCVIGGGKDGNSRDFCKQFLLGRIKLTLE